MAVESHATFRPSIDQISTTMDDDTPVRDFLERRVPRDRRVRAAV
jgi:hypothetical protein